MDEEIARFKTGYSAHDPEQKSEWAPLMWKKRFGSKLNVVWGHLLTHLAMTYREYKIRQGDTSSPELQKMLLHVIYDLKFIIETVSTIDKSTVCFALFNHIFEMFLEINDTQVKDLSSFVKEYSFEYFKSTSSLKSYIE